MERTLFDKIKIYVLCFIMVAIPYGKLIYYILYLTHLSRGDKHIYVLWFMIPVLLILYIIGFIKKKDKFNYLDIINILLIVLAGISTIFALRVKTAIWGEINRYEGLFSLVAYYLIFLNAKSIKDEEDKKFLLKVFIYIALFQVIYSILQVYTNFRMIKRFSISYLAMGLCANPNFLSSYMSMLVILTATLYIKNNKKGYLILAIIFNIGLVLAQSSGPFLAVAMTLIFIMCYFHKKECTKRTIIVILALIACFVVTNTTSLYVQEKVYKKEILSQYNIARELVDTSDKIANASDNKETLKRLGNGRLEIWMKLLPKVKKYWLVGAGLDNIAYIYPQSGYVIYDKAHNVYLQILLTNGLPALVLYCALCLIVFIKGFKLKNDDVALYMLFVVYSIQAFVNISVVDVAPYFFLFFGLLSSNFNTKLFNKNVKELN